MRSIGKGIFNGERRGEEKGKRKEKTPLASNSIRGRVERLKEGRRKKKKMRGRVKKKGEGNDFPNISSKCEVYCEKKIYDFRYLAISISRDFIIIITYTFLNR